jgi:uncharacterized membrane protein
MAALAALGTAETAYLTVAKLTASDVACPVAGACASVLNSSYATLLGLPLPLFGAAAYGAVAALAAAGAREAAAGRDLGPAPRLALAGGVGALAATSAYLMYVLQTSLGGAPCAWCYASAALSFSLAALLVVGLPARQLADAAGPGLASTAAAALLLYFGFAPVEGSTAAGGATFELPYNKPEVTKESTPRSVALAERLRDSGAQMFGAFWCSHCFEQEQTFGKQAMAGEPRRFWVVCCTRALGAESMDPVASGGVCVTGTSEVAKYCMRLGRPGRPFDPAALQNSASPVTVSLLAAAFPYVECFPDGWRRVSCCSLLSHDDRPRFGLLVQQLLSDAQPHLRRHRACAHVADLDPPLCQIPGARRHSHLLRPLACRRKLDSTPLPHPLRLATPTYHAPARHQSRLIPPRRASSWRPPAPRSQCRPSPLGS